MAASRLQERQIALLHGLSRVESKAYSVDKAFEPALDLDLENGRSIRLQNRQERLLLDILALGNKIEV